jgi:hypothetical protein
LGYDKGLALGIEYGPVEVLGPVILCVVVVSVTASWLRVRIIEVLLVE